ncbi:MAG: hypothetical protein N2652_08920 [Kiritimatiellae bacterium]|nr:hypothetical protein [Kiritimatiellia bacterium]
MKRTRTRGCGRGAFRRWTRQGLVELGALLMAAGGCGHRPAEPFAEHRSLAAAVLSAVRELEQRRVAIEASNDVLAMLDSLRFLQPAPAPEPEPAPNLAPPSAEVGPADAPAETPSPPSMPPGPPRLQGIVRHPREPLAILGGRTVGAGERVDGYLLQRVGSDRVELLAPDGTVVELRLHETGSSKP